MNNCLFIQEKLYSVIDHSKSFFTLIFRTTFHHVSRSLCPSLNTNKNKTMPYFYVDVSTESLSPINYTLLAHVVDHFTLR